MHVADPVRLFVDEFIFRAFFVNVFFVGDEIFMFFREFRENSGWL